MFIQLDDTLFRLPVERLKAHSDVFADMFICATPQVDSRGNQEGTSDLNPIFLPFPKEAFLTWLDFVFDPELYVHLPLSLLQH